MIINYINTLVLLVSQLEAESKGGVRDTDWQPQSCQHTDVPTPHTHTSWIRNTHHWTLNQKNQFYSSKIGIRYCTLLLNVEINKCQHNMIRVWIATSTDLNSSWWVYYQITYMSKYLILIYIWLVITTDRTTRQHTDEPTHVVSFLTHDHVRVVIRAYTQVHICTHTYMIPHTSKSTAYTTLGVTQSNHWMDHTLHN